MRGQKEGMRVGKKQTEEEGKSLADIKSLSHMKSATIQTGSIPWHVPGKSPVDAQVSTCSLTQKTSVRLGQVKKYVGQVDWTVAGTCFVGITVTSQFTCDANWLKLTLDPLTRNFLVSIFTKSMFHLSQ